MVYFELYNDKLVFLAEYFSMKQWLHCDSIKQSYKECQFASRPQCHIYAHQSFTLHFIEEFNCYICSFCSCQNCRLDCINIYEYKKILNVSLGNIKIQKLVGLTTTRICKQKFYKSKISIIHGVFLDIGNGVLGCFSFTEQHTWCVM